MRGMGDEKGGKGRLKREGKEARKRGKGDLGRKMKKQRDLLD